MKITPLLLIIVGLATSASADIIRVGGPALCINPLSAKFWTEFKTETYTTTVTGFRYVPTGSRYYYAPFSRGAHLPKERLSLSASGRFMVTTFTPVSSVNPAVVVIHDDMTGLAARPYYGSRRPGFSPPPPHHNPRPAAHRSSANGAIWTLFRK